MSRHRDGWLASGGSWRDYLDSWAAQEGLHAGADVLAALDARFDRRSFALGPYVFADLADTSESDEQAAIDAGRIMATGIRYAGRLRA